MSRAHGSITAISHHACQSNINKKKTIHACLARLHGVLLLCTRLANDRPLSSSEAVWAGYELMHCNMTVIIPLGEPAVLQGSFSFSCEPKVSQLPPSLSCILSSVLLSHHPLLFSPLLLLPFLSSLFNSYTDKHYYGDRSQPYNATSVACCQVH